MVDKAFPVDFLAERGQDGLRGRWAATGRGSGQQPTRHRLAGRVEGAPDDAPLAHLVLHLLPVQQLTVGSVRQVWAAAAKHAQEAAFEATFAKPPHCTDNAVMIAGIGDALLSAGRTDDLRLDVAARA